jgi:hypothetical protein
MDRIKRSVLAAAVAGALCGGVGMVHAIASTASQGVQKLDDDHWKFPHMHHAMAMLREARKDMDEAEDIFHGHKQDAIDHVDKAIAEIKIGLHEQHDEELAAIPTALPAASKLEDDHFPRVHAALERMKHAKEELEGADTIFAGHRDEAIRHTEKAIKQLEDGLHDAGA